MHILDLPKRDHSNGWSRILPERKVHMPLKEDETADWVVVGAGYAGLAAARRLAENAPNDRIIVLEALEAGENASGRNSGFGIDLPHVVGSAQDDLSVAHAHLRLSRAALKYLEGIVEEHGVACDWSRAGKYHAAVTPRGEAEMLAPFVEMLKTLDEPHRILYRAETAKALGTSYYHASVYTPGDVLVNPAALTRGLADTLPENVTVHEHSPVIEFTRDSGISLRTPRAIVRAPRMILAVNGHAPKFGFWKRHLLPFSAHASLTRPLTEKEHQSLGGVESWGVTPVNAFVSTTMRYTTDRRIMIRYLLRYCPSQLAPEGELADVRAAHQKVLRGRFPMLPEVTIDHTWTGYVCLSRNNAPGFGKIDDNVWSAVCCNAVGITKATIAGMLAADLACEVDNPLIADMDELGKPQALPLRPFLDVGVRVRNAWDMWRGSEEY